jgi:hypothetical protein
MGRSSSNLDTTKITTAAFSGTTEQSQIKKTQQTALSAISKNREIGLRFLRSDAPDKRKRFRQRQFAQTSM